jgi:hypothetical protein
LISEEYDTPVKVSHGVVQCRYLDVLDFGVQLRTTYNERFALALVHFGSSDCTVPRITMDVDFSTVRPMALNGKRPVSGY